MKILVLSNLYPPDVLGGYEIACAQIVDGLRSLGHETRVLTSRPRELIADDCESGNVRRLLHIVEYSTDKAMGRYGLAFQLNEAESRYFNSYNVHILLSEIQNFHPDIIYIHNIVDLGGLGLLAAIQFLKVPWVWHLGDCVPKELCSNEHGIVPELAERFSAEVRGTFISVSQRLIDEIANGGMTLKERVELIPYWIQGDRSKDRLPRPLYRSGNRLRIMSAGRLSHQKGTDLLIMAAAELVERGFDGFTVDFYGHIADGSFAQEIRRLGLGSHVQLKGTRRQAELIAIYRDYDVFAFPTQSREPFGLVPLEAASQGCLPVIAESCGVAEWLVHGVHCLKAKRTPEAFAEVFQKILEGEIEVGPIARRAEEAAWNDFHLKVVLPRIEQLLFDAARQTREGAGDFNDAYRMARMAEQMSRLLIEEALDSPPLKRATA